MKYLNYYLVANGADGYLDGPFKTAKEAIAEGEKAYDKDSLLEVVKVVSRSPEETPIKRKWTQVK